MIVRALKAIVTIMLSLVMALSCCIISGCSTQEEEQKVEGIENYKSDVSYFGLHIDNEKNFTFLSKFNPNEISDVSYTRTSGGVKTFNSSDKSVIMQGYDALVYLQSTGKDNYAGINSDNKETITFTSTDGEKYSFQFVDGMALIDENQYILSNTGNLNAFISEITGEPIPEQSQDAK